MMAATVEEVSIGALARGYQQGRTPRDIIAEVMARIAACERQGIWIHVATDEQLARQLAALDAARAAGKALPLHGIPFAVKDNIDVADMPTTAACPAFTYTPAASATCVQRLCDAGAIVVGKTNLDQFATGLVGTRSPYGACENVFDPRYISGGSSSGSAAAVAAGLVSFALATDTAGSGRVPAAFNNIVGLKPTRGIVSNAGVVPACRSLDCVAFFTANCAEAMTLLNLAAAFDPADACSRPTVAAAIAPPGSIACGIPEQLEFFGNRDFETSFKSACNRLQQMGAKLIPFDLRPFLRVGDMLYNGPWVAERLVAAGKLLAENPAALQPEIRTILEGARRYTATDAFEGLHQLAQLKAETRRVWATCDVLMLPTAGTIYRIEEIASDPLGLNRNLGRYTTFANLLDLSAIAIPAGFTPAGLPFGVSFIAPAFQESRLLSIGHRFQMPTPVEVPS